MISAARAAPRSSQDNNAGVGLELIDPETGAKRRFRNPCGGDLPRYSTDRAFVACGETEIRTASGKIVRRLKLAARNESTHIGPITLGPRGRPFVYDAVIDERAADIWLLGSRLRRLTSGPGDGGLWIASLATRRAQRLTSGREPAWSRDGRRIAFADRNSIGSSGRTGRASAKIATVAATVEDLAWSPEGRAIADATGETISVISLTNGTIRQPVSETDNVVTSPTWSPDGRGIAYATGWTNDIPYPWQAPEAHFLEIWTVDVASGARSPLVQSPGFNFAPGWR